ncbi:hypothetical protein [Chryseobacterium paludis]|uniref:hypothetical protein n=1 Tax=Chryseobacterium paludis TaxID=2956784 RepID=UPI0021C18881|nr:hypothetical protein [Chryseobacterium paludis]
MQTTMILITFIMFISCKSQYLPIIGDEYIYENNNRKVSIQILDKNNLIIKSIFNCTNIDDQFKNIIFKKKYRISKNKIIILNPEKEEFKLPYFNDSDCNFLSEKYRTNIRHLYDGRNFYPDKSLYSIPNIDTLTIMQNNSLFYYKKVTNGSVGFIFKKSSNTKFVIVSQYKR